MKKLFVSKIEDPLPILPANLKAPIIALPKFSFNNPDLAEQLGFINGKPLKEYFAQE